MKSVGIVVAKKDSRRFPGKNSHVFRGVPLFWHSVNALLNSKVDCVVVATNSQSIQQYCKKKGVHVVWRGVNASEPEEPLFDVIKYCYKCLDEKFDIIVSLMANSIGHTPVHINQCVRFLKQNDDILELRSYGINGKENGILVIKSKVMCKHELSTYMATYQNEALEIHRERDLKFCPKF